jgi:hypothetical protein
VNAVPVERRKEAQWDEGSKSLSNERAIATIHIERKKKTMSSKRLSSLLLVAVMALVALAGVTGAAASPPSQASGTFDQTSNTFTSVRFAGGNRIAEGTATFDYTGTMEGSSTAEVEVIFHADGSVNAHRVEVFTGTVDGAAGTLTFNASASTHDGVYEATLVIVGGTGGLSDMHGVINVVGTVRMPGGPEGTYTGQLQTAP